ncbi:MAG: entericidin A/B family lipoprotein [Sulfuritalea sp.]|nr:entericidin A/B family lipoprotein [Sulfuritalea sp.]
MLRILFISMLLIGLSACNTVEGIGKDLKKGGEAIEKSVK